MSLVNKFLENPYEQNIQNLVKLGKMADNAYYNSDEPILTDLQYDLLRNIIKKKDPSNKYVHSTGAKVTKKKIKLPYVLGSAKKPGAKEIEKFLEKFTKKYPPPYIISEKLDGVSALFQNDKNLLMTKGDSEIGTDISNLIPYLVDHSANKKCDIRGEIIISKSKFEKYQKIKKNGRNMVTGLIGAKVLSDELYDCDFVTYEILNPWIPFDKQMELLAKMGYKTVKYELTNDISVENLLKYYRHFVNSSKYECDGIIVSANSPLKRDNIQYPDYMFAFKSLDDLQSVNVTVKKVLWQISKDGYIKPVISFDPVLLNGVEIKRVTSYNAKYIYDNSVGPGTTFELVRSGGVIPYIKRFIKTSKKPQMPDDISWTWNISGVDIITEQYTEEQQVRELAKFFSEIGVDNLAKQNVKKLINAKINTIPKIIKITKKQLLTVENFKEKMVDKIYKDIHDKIEKVSLPEFMVATNIFGHGFGKRLLNNIFNQHPDIIFKYIEMKDEDFKTLLLNVENFGEERTNQFIDSMKPFLELFEQLPDKLQDRLITFTPISTKEVAKETNNKFLNKTFVFSGIRNKEWEQLIESSGGKIGTSVSSKTFAVISTIEEIEKGMNSKIVLAKSLSTCNLWSLEQFNDFLDK